MTGATKAYKKAIEYAVNPDVLMAEPDWYLVNLCGDGGSRTVYAIEAAIWLMSSATAKQNEWRRHSTHSRHLERLSSGKADVLVTKHLVHGHWLRRSPI